MKTYVEQMTNYANYHRDPRNIATHFVGIPMIVFAITVLFSRPSFELLGISMTPALLMVVASSAYYLRLHLFTGVIMTALLIVALIFAQDIAAMGTMAWLAWGIGLFVVGWVFQFVGHFYEGKKPAFVDDLMGLIIGPLFVLSEFLFMFGLLGTQKADIEREAGPVAKRDKSAVSSS